MNYKANQKKSNRILYITVVLILCVMTVIIGITSAAQRKQRSPVNEQSTAQSTDSSPARTQKPEQTQSADNETDRQTEPPASTDTSGGGGSTPVQNELPTFIMPVSGSISKRHDDSAPVYSLTMEDYRVHLGVDISTTLGQAVLAAADGVITQIFEDPMMGVCMFISHAGDAVSIYKNLAPDFPDGIEEGVNVKAGQTVAAVGESALIEISEAPHLHYELKIADNWVDPLNYFPASAGVSSDMAYEG